MLLPQSGFAATAFPANALSSNIAAVKTINKVGNRVPLVLSIVPDISIKPPTKGVFIACRFVRRRAC
jgi:hypothetical protein